MTSLKAAAAHFGIVFLAGSFLGTVRELLITPLVVPDHAVALEVPLMTFASFVAARWTLARFEVPTRTGDRVFVGTAALLLLPLAEEILTQVTQGQSVLMHWAGFGRSPASRM